MSAALKPEDLLEPGNFPDDLKWVPAHYKLHPTDPVYLLIAWHWRRVKQSEDTLKATIVEIKKGAKGADCLQIVNSRMAQNCGKIYYESKRTKDFQASWIDKFKGDMREKGADIGVLVSEVLPKGFDRMGMLDGVWVCTYEEFKGLSLVLRESVIKLSEAIASQENKGDKMHLLYDFLTGNAFKLQVEAIVEGFSGMKNSLETEKRSMQRIWKEREKQIDKVIENTIDMYGSIRGIAGNAVQPIQALELGGGQELLD